MKLIAWKEYDIWYLDRIIGHSAYRPRIGDRWYGMRVKYVNVKRHYAVVEDV